MNVRGWVAALLGISAYTAATTSSLSLDDPAVQATREQLGGQLSPMPQTRLRWYESDLERAMRWADAGNLSEAAQLARSIRRDAILSGVLATRTSGIVGLPKRFTGADDVVRALEGRDGVRSVFDEMCPPSELALLAADGLLLGVGVGELVPVPERGYPVLRRHDPQWLQYRWSENRWYYLSVVGAIPITPGDGRWVLHIDGGFISPWQQGLWYALGQAWIRKQHAGLHKANWEAKLANPARVATSPNGASEEAHQSWWKAVMAWGINTVFGVKPGYDVKLLESNGRGWESFKDTETFCDRQFVIAITGSTVLVDGGTGFANADVHQSIRADLIKGTAEALAYTINTQVIPQFVAAWWGVEALARSAVLEWITTPPQDLKAEADAMGSFGTAITSANQALQPYGRRVDAEEMAERFGVVLEPLTDEIEEEDDAGAEIIPIDFASDDEDVAEAA